MIALNQDDKKQTKHCTFKRSSLEYKIIYFLVFSSSFTLACLVALSKKLMHPFTSTLHVDYASPLAEARNAADSSVPYIFSR